MKSTLTKHSPLIAALILGASAAQADVTPQQVWDNWLEQMQPYGYDISVTETQQGNDLAISDMVMTIDMPEDEGSVIVSMPGFTFIDNGDGTVGLDMPSSYPINVKIDGEYDQGNVQVDYNTTGLTMTVSGEPDAMRYDYSAASIEASLAALEVEGEAIDLGMVKATLINVSGDSMIAGNMLMTSDQKFSADQIQFTVDVSDPEGSGEYIKVNAAFNDLAFDGNASIPKDMDPEDIAKMLALGFAYGGEFSHQGGEANFDIDMDGDKLAGQQSSGSGSFSMSMNEEAFALSMNATDGKATMQVPDLPFPVSYEMGETGIDFVIPIAMNDEEQDFKAAITLGDFSMADMLWSIFDPTEQLPRDPATISFDVTGKVKLLANIFDPESIDLMAAPGELHAVNLNDITIRAVGAELTGQGAFTFDNSDLASFDGMPRPEGSAELFLTGGNALMDKAVAMGLASEEDVMGARMMMGMFTVPGEGEDSLKSKIEVNAEGHVLANGMRLK